MKSGWKSYLTRVSLILLGGLFVFLTIETYEAKNMGFETKTYWDWMELLIIPLFLAGGAFFLNRSEKEIERKATEDRAKLEREIAKDRQQEEALQSYLDRMADSLLNDSLRATENNEVRDVARIRTLTVLRGLDGKRKGFVLLFLKEAKLIERENPIIKLEGADLNDIYLSNTDLSEISLRNTNLQKAKMMNVSLYFSDLSGVDLSGADLQNSAFWRTNLFHSKLVGANLQNSDLRAASFYKADLSNANLLEAYIVRDIEPEKDTLFKKEGVTSRTE